MNQSVPQLETPTEVRAKLDSLRLAIRRYVWFYGIAALFCAIGAAFWTSLVLDWFFEPPVAFRAVMQLTVAGIVLWLFYMIVIDRLRYPMTDASMALLMERQFPELSDSLLTSIDPYMDDIDDEAGLSAFLYQEAGAQAAQKVGSLNLGNVFDYKVLRRSVLGATILWILIGIFVVLFPGAAKVWAQRVLCYSTELWPRKTHLVLDGAENNMLKVAHGDDLAITVMADMNKVVPKTVRVERYMKSGREEEKTMTREGEAIPGQDPYQLFSHTFHAIREDFEFYIEGGDADLGPIKVVVVASPAVESMKLECTYPEYMERSGREMQVIGPMSIPRGTQITVVGRSAKPLTGVAVEQLGLDPKEQEKHPVSVTLDPKDPHSFTCQFEQLMDSKSYRFTLTDTDGIRGRNPYILNLMATDDEAPVLPDDLYGIGMFITPNAYLPIVGRATDDFGIAKIWYDYTINPEKKGEESSAGPGNEEEGKTASQGPQAPELHGVKEIVQFEKPHPVEYDLNAKLDLKEGDLKVNGQVVPLEPGQKITVTVSAIDLCSFDGANVGSSRRCALEIVTHNDLEIYLMARELVMRQRFEAIMSEVKDTQKIMKELDFTVAKDENARLQDDLGIRRAMENCRKNAEETKAVADVFENIRLQKVHNRIAKGDDNQRLAELVIVPLEKMVDQTFPDIEQDVEQILTHLSDPAVAESQRQKALDKLGDLLDAMNLALKNMLQLEDKNKLIKMLIDIRDDQKGMESRIRKLQKKMLQNLLED
ncbi:MAG: hypothetical protein PVH19_02670 [Planctomycetia bacterium]